MGKKKRKGFLCESITYINKTIWLKVIIIFFIGCFVLFGIPLIINYFLFKPWPPTPEGLGNTEWLAFWASFIGSLIGGVATFIAVTITLNNNIEVNDDNREFQKSILEEQSEKRRLELKPFLGYKPNLQLSDLTSYSKYNQLLTTIIIFTNNDEFTSHNTVITVLTNKNIRTNINGFEETFLIKESKFEEWYHANIRFCVENISSSVATAISLKIHKEEIQISNFLGPKEFYPLIFFFSDELETEVSFQFFDIFNNKYQQVLSVYAKDQSKITSTLTRPILIKRADKTDFDVIHKEDSR